MSSARDEASSSNLSSCHARPWPAEVGAFPYPSSFSFLSTTLSPPAASSPSPASPGGTRASGSAAQRWWRGAQVQWRAAEGGWREMSECHVASPLSHLHPRRYPISILVVSGWDSGAGDSSCRRWAFACHRSGVPIGQPLCSASRLLRPARRPSRSTGRREREDREKKGNKGWE